MVTIAPATAITAPITIGSTLVRCHLCEPYPSRVEIKLRLTPESGSLSGRPQADP